jgi:hypothetical protein
MTDNFQKAMKELAGSFKTYFDELTRSGFAGVQPFLASLVGKNLERTLKMPTGHSSSLSGVADAFSFCYELYLNYFGLLDCYKIFREHEIKLDDKDKKMSSGAVLTYDYLQKLNELLMALGKDMHVVTKMEVMIIPTILSHLGIPKLDDAVKEFEKYLKDGASKYVINFYTEFLRQALNTPLTDHKLVIKQLETLKTDILTTDFIPALTSNREKNVFQRLVQKYNLSPDGPPRPLAELFKSLGCSGPFDKAAKFLTRAGKHRIGFIVINSTLDPQKPVLHNIWTLTDRKYIEASLQEPTVGVNSKTLERYQNIRILDSDHTSQNGLQFFNAEFDGNNNQYYILETLDGQNYWFLVGLSQPKPELHPAELFVGLGGIETCPSKRLEAYTAKINGALVKHLVKPKNVEQLSRAEKNIDKTYWLNLRNKIARGVAEWLPTTADSPSRRLAFINEIFNDKLVYKKIILEMSEQISISLTNNILETPHIKQYLVEIFLSYFKDIEKVQKTLQQDTVELLPTVKESSLSTNTKVSDAIQTLVSSALEKYINPKSGIYITIANKLNFLNNTLLIQT